MSPCPASCGGLDAASSDGTAACRDRPTGGARALEEAVASAAADRSTQGAQMSPERLVGPDGKVMLSINQTKHLAMERRHHREPGPPGRALGDRSWDTGSTWMSRSTATQPKRGMPVNPPGRNKQVNR